MWLVCDWHGVRAGFTVVLPELAGSDHIRVDGDEGTVPNMFPRDQDSESNGMEDFNDFYSAANAARGNAAAEGPSHREASRFSCLAGAVIPSLANVLHRVGAATASAESASRPSSPFSGASHRNGYSTQPTVDDTVFLEARMQRPSEVGS
jgi:hypothetical protein